MKANKRLTLLVDLRLECVMIGLMGLCAPSYGQLSDREIREVMVESARAVGGDLAENSFDLKRHQLQLANGNPGPIVVSADWSSRPKSPGFRIQVDERDGRIRILENEARVFNGETRGDRKTFAELRELAFLALQKLKIPTIGLTSEHRDPTENADNPESNRLATVLWKQTTHYPLMSGAFISVRLNRRTGEVAEILSQPEFATLHPVTDTLTRIEAQQRAAVALREIARRPDFGDTEAILEAANGIELGQARFAMQYATPSQVFGKQAPGYPPGIHRLVYSFTAENGVFILVDAEEGEALFGGRTRGKRRPSGSKRGATVPKENPVLTAKNPQMTRSKQELLIESQVTHAPWLPIAVGIGVASGLVALIRFRLR